jgi:hypothetical protein
MVLYCLIFLYCQVYQSFKKLYLDFELLLESFFYPHAFEDFVHLKLICSFSF